MKDQVMEFFKWLHTMEEYETWKKAKVPSLSMYMSREFDAYRNNMEFNMRKWFHALHSIAEQHKKWMDNNGKGQKHDHYG